MTRLKVLTEQNLSAALLAPRDPGNTVDYSQLRQFEHALKCTRFSIKYVLEGTECYQINGQKFQVRQGEYLMLNPTCEGAGIIKDRSFVRGICINILPEIVAEVITTLHNPASAVAEYDLRHFLQTSDFFENQFRASNTHLGRMLEQLGATVTREARTGITFNEAFFYTLTENMLLDYRNVCKQLRSVPAVKISTQKDLLRKVLAGKNCMDDCFTKNIPISDFAKEAGLSEYHFFRLFKKAFQTTPYQYLLEKRLLHAHRQLLSGHCTVSEVALAAGFADIFSFSKAFKKRFGVPPSNLFS
ncbi:MAG: helix-turn-helix transcriptional regulator [Saprospiraceae bacterium]